MFLDENGNVDRDRARYSRASAGVPGTVAGLLYALEHYGTMPRERVLAPAIKLAEEGFPVPYGLAFALWAKATSALRAIVSSQAYFEHPDGEPYKAGRRFSASPILPKRFAPFANFGARGFYEGPVPKLIAEEMKQGGGLITAEDLKNYRPVEREPVRGTYRGYDIVSMPPPSSGGAHVIQLLNILEGYDLAKLGHNTADTIHRLVEAMRRAYADRAKYLGDPGFVKIPLAGLVSKEYAAQLRAGIDLNPGNEFGGCLRGQAAIAEGEQTTHFSIMDKDGNAVSNTYTLNLGLRQRILRGRSGFFAQQRNGRLLVQARRAQRLRTYRRRG